jgi:hypothetical protein
MAISVIDSTSIANVSSLIPAGSITYSMLAPSATHSLVPAHITHKGLK